MKRTTYNIVKWIPIVGGIMKTVTKPLLCSPGLAEGAYDKYFEYLKKHPDIQPTEQLLEAICSGKIK